MEKEHLVNMAMELTHFWLSTSGNKGWQQGQIFTLLSLNTKQELYSSEWITENFYQVHREWSTQLFNSDKIQQAKEWIFYEDFDKSFLLVSLSTMRKGAEHSNPDPFEIWGKKVRMKIAIYSLFWIAYLSFAWLHWLWETNIPYKAWFIKKYWCSTGLKLFIYATITWKCSAKISETRFVSHPGV